jgi:hypothetical protein
MTLEFLLMSLRFNSFILLRDEQCGGVGGHKMHIFTANIPFQEHQMTRGNDVAQRTGSTEPRCGQPATSP